MHICKKFFTLPSDIKQQYARSVVDTENLDHGWVGAEIESLNPTRPGDLKETFNVSTLSSRIVGHKSGQFVAAPHSPNAVLLNIGDLLQRWTSDRLIFTVHRVLLPQSDDKMCQSRQSLAFFVHPDNDVIVTCCDGSEKYPPTNTLQYLMGRINATYIM
ncbi:uncharacterized protein [Scyliorhinus torazame]|uniref:uncharacterized protein n=1 Tax=Scyliorhinus torazame TaxID=75743 RepID=UPI003B5AA211